MNALRTGLIREPYNPRYRNAQLIVQCIPRKYPACSNKRITP